MENFLVDISHSHQVSTGDNAHLKAQDFEQPQGQNQNLEETHKEPSSCLAN